MSFELIIPAMILAALGWSVPRILALFWPEGVKWLMLLALASTILMALLGGVFFAVLFVLEGESLGDLFRTNTLANIAYFGRLSLISALLWAPLMVLSLIYVPRNWVKEVW